MISYELNIRETASSKFGGIFGVIFTKNAYVPAITLGLKQFRKLAPNIVLDQFDHDVAPIVYEYQLETEDGMLLTTNNNAAILADE